MVATPLWFGPRERPLFGWVHWPADHRVRAAVVMCSTMGLEGGFAHHALREIAQTLAARGILVFRFDYDGTGDSAGSGDDPRRVEAWRSSVRLAVERVRAMTDRPVALLGMRVGALLAAYEAERSGDIDALVLWDPPRTGRTFIKELRMRHAASFTSEVTEPVSLLGMPLAGGVADDLRTLDLRRMRPLPADRALILNRPTVAALPAPVPTRSGDDATILEAPDQDELLLSQVTPTLTMTHIVDWITDAYADAEYSIADVPQEPPAPMTLDHEGCDVIESIVALGPQKLFGIVTEPDGPTSGPTVVFVPDAFTPHTGLSRLWVDLARSWAASGLRVLRFDLSGHGDSDPRPGLAPHQVSLLEHQDDVLDMARAISPDDPSNLVLIGTCSGGYQAMEAAFAFAPRGICLVNPAFGVVTPEFPASRRRQARQATRPILARPLSKPIGQIVRRFSPVLRHEEGFDWRRWFEACYWQRAITRRSDAVPEFAWRAMKSLLLTQRPADVLRRIVDHGTNVLVITGDPDIDDLSLGSRKALEKLRLRTGFRLEYLPGLDHSMLKSGQRDRTARLLTEHVFATFDVGHDPGAKTEFSDVAIGYAV